MQYYMKSTAVECNFWNDGKLDANPGFQNNLGEITQKL